MSFSLRVKTLLNNFEKGYFSKVFFGIVEGTVCKFLKSESVVSPPLISIIFMPPILPYEDMDTPKSFVVSYCFFIVIRGVIGFEPRLCFSKARKSLSS